MKIFLKFFSLFFAFLILILNNSEFAQGIGNVDWVLLKENKDGKEWIDMNSIKSINEKEISVLTKFLQNSKDLNDKEKLFLYVMRIDCTENKFKDTSINGIPQLNSNWQTSSNDELIDVVIKKGCAEVIN